MQFCGILKKFFPLPRNDLRRRDRAGARKTGHKVSLKVGKHRGPPKATEGDDDEERQKRHERPRDSTGKKSENGAFRRFSISRKSRNTNRFAHSALGREAVFPATAPIRSLDAGREE